MQDTTRASRPLALPRRTLLAGAATALLIPAAARAAGTLRVSVAEFPGPYTPNMIALLKLGAAKLPGPSFEITTAPFARSLAAVTDGSADIHIPIIRPPHTGDLPFSLAAATLHQTPFVLYTNKDKPISLTDLHEGSKYHIETDVGHVGYFDFPVVGGASNESSLKKVNAGRIDGYIFSAVTSDALIEQLGLKNIHRTFYRMLDVTGALPKGGSGDAADRWLSALVAAGRQDPAFVALQDKANTGYRGPDWQPA
jgi:polar amino acid transport system substrate-binding protein